MKRLTAILFVIFILLITNACSKKNTEIDFRPNVNSSKSLLFSENYMREVLNVFYMAIKREDLLSGDQININNCDIRYFSSENKIHFDYGNHFRHCGNFVYRKGLYVVYLDGLPDIAGTNYTFDFTQDSALFTLYNIKEEAKHIQGDILAVDLGNNQQNKPQLSWEINDVSITNRADSSVHWYNTNFTVTWQSGLNTPEIPEDDLILIIGETSGADADGVHYSTSISTRLENYLDCYWFSSGIHDIQVPSAVSTDGIVDYLAPDMCSDSVNFFFDGILFYDRIE